MGAAFNYLFFERWSVACGSAVSQAEPRHANTCFRKKPNHARSEHIHGYTLQLPATPWATTACFASRSLLPSRLPPRLIALRDGGGMGEAYDYGDSRETYSERFRFRLRHSMRDCNILELDDDPNDPQRAGMSDLSDSSEGHETSNAQSHYISRKRSAAGGAATAAAANKQSGRDRLAFVSHGIRHGSEIS